MFGRFFTRLLLLYVIPVPVFSQVQGRIQWSVNDHWKFLPEGADFGQTPKMDDSGWKTIHLPHTWNASDPFDDDGTSRRGISWYRKKLVLDDRFRDRKLYLYFKGANQIADVYVNGVFAGQHKGGYTAFIFDITHLVKPDSETLIAVQVNNAHDNFIPPLSIGYASYGGIYRDVWLVATDKLHFTTSDHASGGIYLTTPEVSDGNATVQIKGAVFNESDAVRKFEVVNEIYDKQQRSVLQLKKTFSVLPGRELSFEMTGSIADPELWSPDHPNLYRVKSRIIENGRIIDEVSNPLGLRWFSFDPDSGFSLNGKKLMLKGTNRHQDFQARGDALTDNDHYRDIKMIKEMGCNFLRLAHYPQDPEVLRLADEEGLLIWEEIPLVNYMNPVPEFFENSENMIREMIRQNYNHPSVIIWGSMNEVLLWNEMAERIQVQTNVDYVNKVKEYAIKLDSIIKAEDPSRYTTMSMHMSDDYDKFGLSDIPQIAAYNIYNGWYEGKPDEFKPVIDQKHKEKPRQVLFISEYGAESDNRVNTHKPLRLDYTGQYQRFFNESYLRQINQMPYLAGTAIWNEFDFSQPNVGGVSNNMNQKGMVSWDRKPKDVYYLYKANWNPCPMAYIVSRDWQNRAGLPGTTSVIEVYSNTDEVILTVNGRAYPIKRPDDVKKCTWDVVLNDGINLVYATGKKDGKLVSDGMEIHYKAYAADLNDKKTPFSQLSVNAGSNTQYMDLSGNIWIEDRPYVKGSFGYVGGSPATLSIKTVKKNTADLPLFYSYLNDIKEYRFDVADGSYEIELCFIENDRLAKDGRVFDVAVNGDILLKDLDLAAEFGFAAAVKKKFIIQAEKGKGVYVVFTARKGTAVLSGIRLKAK